MAEMSPCTARQLAPPLMIGLTLFVVATDFVFLLVTYLVLASIGPDVLGDVAVSPAKFAAWITLVKLPITLTHILIGSWRGWKAMITRGEPPDSPVRKGWRRTLIGVRHWGADAGGLVIAALVVFGHVADPGDAHVWHLVAVTAAGPFLLPKAVWGSVWLMRWWWRRRRTPRTAQEP